MILVGSVYLDCPLVSNSRVFELKLIARKTSPIRQKKQWDIYSRRMKASWMIKLISTAGCFKEFAVEIKKKLCFSFWFKFIVYTQKTCFFKPSQKSLLVLVSGKKLKRRPIGAWSPVETQSDKWPFQCSQHEKNKKMLQNRKKLSWWKFIDCDFAFGNFHGMAVAFKLIKSLQHSRFFKRSQNNYPKSNFYFQLKVHYTPDPIGTIIYGSLDVTAV